MVSPTSSGTRQDLLGLTLVLCAAAVPLNFFQKHLRSRYWAPHHHSFFRQNCDMNRTPTVAPMAEGSLIYWEENNIIASMSNPLNRFRVWLKKKLVILVVPGASLQFSAKCIIAEGDSMRWKQELIWFVLGTACNLSKCQTLKPQQPVQLTAKLAEPLRPKTWATLKPQLCVLTQISRGVLWSKLCHLPSVNKKVLDFLHHTFPSWSNLFSWKSPWKIVPLFLLCRLVLLVQSECILQGYYLVLKNVAEIMTCSSTGSDDWIF
jgi:hypothetical protein